VTHVARIHYEIPDDLHRRAKSAAALEGKTLKEFVIDAISSAVEPHTKPPGRASKER
jgi:predicted HicB family RNase H-like nuclease